MAELRAQDAKTRKATLKEVGEWLARKLCSGGHGKVGGKYHKDYIGLSEKEIETLLQGKMPGIKLEEPKKNG